MLAGQLMARRRSSEQVASTTALSSKADLRAATSAYRPVPSASPLGADLHGDAAVGPVLIVIPWSSERKLERRNEPRVAGGLGQEVQGSKKQAASARQRAQHGFSELPWPRLLGKRSIGQAAASYRASIPDWCLRVSLSASPRSSRNSAGLMRSASGTARVA